MATVDRPRTKRHNYEHEREGVKPNRKGRAFRYGCYLTLIVLVAAVYLAPTIVARTPLAQWAVQTALQLDGSVALGSVSLGWFSSVEARDVSIRDRDGKSVLDIAALVTEKPLIGLLLDFSDLGLIRVERPVLRVVANQTDTNLEQIFADMLAGESDSHVALRLQIVEGTATIDDLPAERQFRLEDLSLDCAIAGVDEPIRLAASGALPGERHPASFRINLQTQAAAGARSAFASGKIDCQTSALPLELIVPLLRRYVKEAQLTGQLSTRLGGAWGEMAERGEASVRGESRITEFAFASAVLGTDKIELDSVEIPCQIVQQGDRVHVEQLAIHCELGQVSLSGSAKMSDFTATDRMAALLRETYELKGHADLAQLARRLPETLHIRQDTEITSGQVDLVLASRKLPNGMTWTGAVETKQLAAKANGRAFNWNNPLSIEFETHDTKQGLVLDRAQCNSSFLEIDAQGSIDDLKARASFDLARMAQELRQFSDLGGVQLAGQGQAQLVWKRQAGDQFDSHGEFQAQGFQFVAPGGQAWRENKVVAKLDLGGVLADHAVKRVESADLTVEAGGDRLQARLQQALSDPTTTAWPIECSWRGALAAWAPRLESCAGISGWDLGGNGTLQATLRCSREAVDVQTAKADFAQLRAVGHGWFVTEPAASIKAGGRWDFGKSRIETAQVAFSAGNTSATVEQAVFQRTDSGWSLDGAAAQITGDLAQWHRWQSDPRTPAAWQVAGRLSGKAQLKHASGATTGTVDAAIDQLQVVEVARPTGPGASPAAWRERQIVLALRGNYQHDAEQLKLDQIQVACDALRCDASGTIRLAEAGGNVDLKGNVEYDWNTLAPLWRPYLGPSVQIAGRQTRAFAVAGQLTGSPTSSESWRQVTGSAAVGWTSMDLYGLRVGPGEVAAQLAEGHLRGQPMDVAVSDGRFTFTPFVRLSPAPAELVLARGPLLTNVHLSPEMCARGLKFVTPMLAESTVAEGRFSITLDGGRVPIADPRAGDMSGKMAMQAQVKAGPVGQEFMLLINEIMSVLQRGALVTRNDQASSLVSIDSPDIEFRMVGGRVYHRGFKFTVGALPITTHGSVGLDESLALVAEVPIQAKLLGRDLSLGALEGQTIQIPIDGTLSKPRLDRRIVQHLAGQLLQNAARGALLDGLNKQLDRLLPPQP